MKCTEKIFKFYNVFAQREYLNIRVFFNEPIRHVPSYCLSESSWWKNPNFIISILWFFFTGSCSSIETMSFSIVLNTFHLWHILLQVLHLYLHIWNNQFFDIDTSFKVFDSHRIWTRDLLVGNLTTLWSWPFELPAFGS